MNESDLDESEPDEYEDLITCGKCGQAWLIETHKEGFVKALSMLTGYTCKECGDVPREDWTNRKKTMFPARKLSEDE